MPKILDQSYNELVQKAQSLFWNQGYKGTSVKELATHLNVSPSTIYNKYSKEMLFMDSLNYYTLTSSDPFTTIEESTEGIISLNLFFYKLIDALETKTFPRSCLMVNTVVEMRNENAEISELYNSYFLNLITSYGVVIDKAIALGQISHSERRDEYAKFLLGVIFGISVIFKIEGPQACVRYVDEQMSLIS